MNSSRPRGRRPGHQRTRERIVEVARELFLDRGYERTTLRAVAAAAEVDAALIAYHFGSKRGLFAAVMRLRRNPVDVLADVLTGDRTGLADRMLAAVVALWDDEEQGAPLVVLARTGLHDEDLRQAYTEFLEREVLGRIAEFLGGPDATARAAAATTLIGGLIMTRYLMPLNPTARLSAREVRRRLGPPLRLILDGTGPRARPASR